MKLTGLRAFRTFGLGQVISIFGTSLSSFALGVWVFERTHSIAQFALVSVVSTVPAIFIRPFSGALVDRFDRRLLLMASDSIAALATVMTLALVLSNRLSTAFIYLLTFIQTVASALQLPASTAAIQLMVPARDFGKASGTLGTLKSVSTVFAPLVAGGLLTKLGLAGILCIDLGTFLFAVLTLGLISVPRVAPASGALSTGHLLHELREGWDYLRSRRSFVILTAGAMFITGVFELARVLLTPLVLGFASPATLGTILSAAGVGVVLGNVLMMLWGGARQRMVAVLAGGMTISVSLMFGGLRASALWVGAAVMAVMFAIPVVAVSMEAIWMSKVPPHLMGRIKGTSSALESLMATLTLLLSGLVADRVFEPLMSPKGALAATVGKVLGVGPGRGVALMLVGVGAASLLAFVLASLQPSVRRLEDQVPDVDVQDYVTVS